METVHKLDNSFISWMRGVERELYRLGYDIACTDFPWERYYGNGVSCKGAALICARGMGHNET